MRRAILRAKAIALFAAMTLMQANAAERQIISTPNAPNAIGPYSQGIRAGNTLYVSGEIAIDPKTNQVMAGANIEDQTRRALENIKAIVEASGLAMQNVVSVTVYMTDIDEFDRMNQVYAAFFGSSPPARATVQVARLARNVKIEISAIAVAP